VPFLRRSGNKRPSEGGPPLTFGRPTGDRGENLRGKESQIFFPSSACPQFAYGGPTSADPFRTLSLLEGEICIEQGSEKKVRA